MRSYPHTIDEDTIERHFGVKKAHYARRLAGRRMAEARGDRQFFLDRHVEARQLAAMSYALEEPPEFVQKWLRASSAHAGSAWELEPVAPAYTRLVFLAAGVLTGNQALVEDVIREHAPVDHIGRVFAALAALIQGDAEAAGVEATTALAQLNPETDLFGPVLRMVQGIAREDLDTLERGLRDQHEECVACYDESLGVDADGLIDLGGLAALSLALERGMVPDVESVFLPLSLLTD